MYIGCFKEIGDEAVDGKTAAECLAKDLEPTELLGKGEEAGTEAHCDGFGVGFDGLVGNIWERTELVMESRATI